MGCDIHSFAETWENGQYKLLPGVTPFNWRSYNMFAFLAGVRNYSAVIPLANRRGLPVDLSSDLRSVWEDEYEVHSPNWVTLQELISFNYDQSMENRRCEDQGVGGLTCPPGEGRITTYRAFLGPAFFTELRCLQDLKVSRVVMWFDN